MNYYIIIYFLVGLIQDFLIAFYYRLVTKGAGFPAGFLSFLITIINLAVIYTILEKFNLETSFLAIFAYAIGNGVGTYIGVKSKLGILVKK